MTFFERYLNGEREKVYEEIYALELNELNSTHKEDINNVLDETFGRVRYNLTEIHNELRNTNYLFLADSYGDADKPLIFAEGNQDTLIHRVEQKMEPYLLPLSLKYFYKYIANCDFTWDWKNSPEIPWEGSDPLVMASPDYILEYSDISSSGELLVSPDDLHKDNVSGDGYYLGLEKHAAVDVFISSYNIRFIEYLRLTFLNGGFTGADQLDYPSLRKFQHKIANKLLLI